MDPGTLVVRADASVQMGTGHVMRCLALAQAWQDAGGDVVLATAQTTPALAERLRAEKVHIVSLAAPPGSSEDAEQLADLARARGAKWVVLDGYHFLPDYQRRIKDAQLKLLLVDDTGGSARYLADVVLNQNLHAAESMYPQREPYTRLLLGTRYVMLRREFGPWRGLRREVSPVGSKILVTMGGSDALNLTGRVIEAIGSLRQRDVQTRVVVGAGNPHLSSLECVVEQFEGAMQLERSPGNIPDLMAWADVAVSAAGSTCWELCLLGLPAMVLDVAENQRGIARSLDAEGVANHVGNAETTAAEIASSLESLLSAADIRAEMSRRGQALVDGEGAERVVSALRPPELRVRRAEDGDCRPLWEWVNDPAVRAASFSSGPIAWPEHVRWFQERLADRNSLLYFGLDSEGRPLGQVRFQLDGARAVVSIVLAPQSRGRGYGKAILAKAQSELFASTLVHCIDAYVKPGNQASVRLFAESGFKRTATVTIRGQEALHFVLERERLS